MKKEILGVRIDDLSEPETINKILKLVQGDNFGKLVFTVGPEFLVMARRDEGFKKILNAGDLNLPDGRGLQIFGGIKNRVPGVDLMLALCREASRLGWTVGLLGGQEGVAKETGRVLVQKFKGLKIKWAIDGKEADEWIASSQAPRNDMVVDLLFVALGHPKQEKLLYRFRVKPGMTSSVIPAKAGIYFRVGMGVGGSFDYISGRIKRAPVWMQKIGLEWLYRFYQEPRRFWRIIKAIVIYPSDILLNDLRHLSKRV